MAKLLIVCALPLVAAAVALNHLAVCKGDTRGDKKCNHDATHRVCARIGEADSSFWEFTGQKSWCMTKGNYGGEFGSDLRCPTEEPTWCICKWATAEWIKGEGCNNNVSFDCAATDVCDLKCSYTDFSVDLKPAHDCIEKKCAAEWNDCPECVVV